MPGKKSPKRSETSPSDKPEPPPEVESPPPPEPGALPFSSRPDADNSSEKRWAVEDELGEEEQEEEEEDLLLSLLPTGLSQLSMSVKDGGSVYSRLTLANKEIDDISNISTCPNLRHVDLSHNNISDLTPLGDIKYVH